MTVRSASAAIVLVSATIAVASGADALATLRTQFGDAIESESGRSLEIRYCPDNTCESFRSARRARAADVADFALLYLWGVSDYLYLEQWKKEGVPTAVEDALRRRRRECSSGNQQQRLACALRALAKGCGIQLSFIRYDEGVVAEEKIDLEQALGRLP